MRRRSAVLAGMADVNINMGGLSLDGDEDEGLSLGVRGGERVENDLQLRLVGRFLTDRPFRVVIMRERMTSIWWPVRGVVIKEASPGIFLFQFFHKKDMESIVKGGPWSFDNYLLILGCMQVGVPIQNIPLNHVEF